MSAEEIESSMKAEVLDDFAEMIDKILQILTAVEEHVEPRSVFEDIIIVLNMLPCALEATLETFPVPEESLSSLNALRSLLEEALQIVGETGENRVIPGEAVGWLNGIGFSVTNEYVRTYEEIFQVLAWNTDDHPGLIGSIEQLRSHCEFVFGHIELPSGSNIIRVFLESLQDVLENNAFEEVYYEYVEYEPHTDDEVPDSYNENRATDVLIEENTVRYRYQKVHVSTQDNDIVQQCVICIASFENDDDARRLPCMHVFHSNCVDNWLRRDRTCPICRNNITEEKKGFPLHLKDKCVTVEMQCVT